MKLDKLQLMIAWDDRPTSPRYMPAIVTFQTSGPDGRGSAQVKLSDELLARAREEITKQLVEGGKLPKDLEPQAERAKPAPVAEAAVAVPARAAAKKASKK